MTALETPPEPEPVDRLVAALSTDVNREALAYLRSCSADVVGLDELADSVAASRARDPERVAIRLHHAGLPKLADAGVLEYDAADRNVRRVEHAVFEVDDVGELLRIP